MENIVKCSGKYAVYCIGFFLTATMLLSCDRYVYVDTYHDGLARVQLKNGNWGYIDVDKKEVIPCIYFDATYFLYGYAVVAKDKGKYGLIDKNGTEVLPCQYDFINDISRSEILQKVALNGKFGLFDLTRKVFFLPCKYDDIQGYAGKEKLITIKLDNKYGMLDESGNEILPCIYDKIQSTSKGILVQLNGKYGIINKEGKEIISCIYDNIGYFNNNYKIVSVSLNNKSGYIDLITGKEFIPVIYDNIKEYGDNWLATLKSETFVIDRQGKKTNIRFGTMRFGSTNRIRFVDTETGRQLSYRSIVVDDTEVVQTRLVREQGTEMVEFTLVASKLIGTRQEGSKTISSYSGSKTVSYSLGFTFNYELSNGVLKIRK